MLMEFLNFRTTGVLKGVLRGGNTEEAMMRWVRSDVSLEKKEMGSV